jgi:exosortase/archaeosortase family protein
MKAAAPDTAWWAARWPAGPWWYVGALFILLTAGFESILLAASRADALDGLIAVTTRASAFLIGLFGIPFTVAKDSILLDGVTLGINLECTGAFVAAAFGALVIAYPSSTKQKLTGLLVGIAVIGVANLVRIALVAVAAEWAPGYFAFLHDYLYQVALVFIAAVVWLVWMGRVHADA